MNSDTSSLFLKALTKSLRHLSRNCIDFETTVLVTGNVYVSMDSKEKIHYVLNEKLYKNDSNQVEFLGNSFPSTYSKHDSSDGVEHSGLSKAMEDSHRESNSELKSENSLNDSTGNYSLPQFNTAVQNSSFPANIKSEFDSALEFPSQNVSAERAEVEAVIKAGIQSVIKSGMQSVMNEEQSPCPQPCVHCSLESPTCAQPCSHCTRNVFSFLKGEIISVVILFLFVWKITDD